MADVPNRGKAELKLRRELRKVFKPRRQSESRRQPGWVSVQRDVFKAVDKVLGQAQVDAARNLAAQIGDLPLPPSFKVDSLQSADLSADLVRVSRQRWEHLPRVRGRIEDEALAGFKEKNFGEGRISLIATTEITRAHTIGEIAAREWLREQGVEIVGIWHVEKNCSKSGPCRACKDQDGKDDSVWSRFYPKGPPSPHPGCCCWIEWIRV